MTDNLGAERREAGRTAVMNAQVNHDRLVRNFHEATERQEMQRAAEALALAEMADPKAPAGPDLRIWSVGRAWLVAYAEKPDRDANAERRARRSGPALRAYAHIDVTDAEILAYAKNGTDAHCAARHRH